MSVNDTASSVNDTAPSVNDTAPYEGFIKNEVSISSVANIKEEAPSRVRTRKELSLKEKLEVLKQYDNLPKMSQRCAAVKLNISQPVLCKILKNRNFIENITRTNENSVRKRARGGKEREIESALKVWCVEVQNQDIPINGRIIREKAKELARQMGTEFAATDGWFTRWRKRENIVYNTLLRRKFKTEREYDYFRNDSEENKPWGEGKVQETCQVYNDAYGNEFTEACKVQTPDSADCHMSEKNNSDSKVPDNGKSKNSETENLGEVFIKTEPDYDEEFETERKPNVIAPTDEEMLEALRILNAGVRHRTSVLQPHFEYELFIYDLLNKVV